MMQKLWERLTNNFALKLISVIFACVLWLVVVNVDNPLVTRSFKAMAKIENEDIITNNGKVFEILDESQMITFTVTGPRSIVERLSGSDFKVVADMDKIQLDYGLVPIDVTPIRYESQLDIGVKIPNLHVKIQNLVEQQFVVTGNSTGTPLAGYAKGDILVQPNMISISGPEEVMKRVKKAVAAVNIEGAYAEKTEAVIPVLVDEEGKQLDMTNVTITPKSVTVRAEILETKKVSITVKPQGTVAAGYVYNGVDCSPTSVTVKGTKEELEKFTELLLPSTEMDISGAKTDVEKVVNVSQYLPEGVELVDPELTTAIITAKIAALDSKVLTLEMKNITILNLPANYMLKFEESSVKVTIKGQKAVLDAFTINDLTAQLDLTGVSKGSVRLDLKLILPTGIEPDGIVKISATVVESTDSGNAAGN
ncbi:MAG: hypothetical protein KA953_01835 [Lachnospiraceae bacterium]|nr:hypothetical protein [Lachnospiraceae bacterium]